MQTDIVQTDRIQCHRQQLTTPDQSMSETKYFL